MASPNNNKYKRVTPYAIHAAVARSKKGRSVQRPRAIDAERVARRRPRETA